MGAPIFFVLIPHSHAPQVNVHHNIDSDIGDTRQDVISIFNPWYPWCDVQHSTETLHISCVTGTSIATITAGRPTNNILRTGVPPHSTILVPVITQKIGFPHPLSLTRYHKTELTNYDASIRYQVLAPSNTDTDWSMAGGGLQSNPGTTVTNTHTDHHTSATVP